MPRMNGAGKLGRRHFLSILGSSGLIVANPSIVRAQTIGNVRCLSMRNLHTGERLSADFQVDGEFETGALEEFNHLLRDWRTDDVSPIDPGLLTFLSDVTDLVGSGEEIGIISGYRSPKTNQMLKAKGGGVAKKSLHMQGRAIDVRIAGRTPAQVRDAAISLQRGGVGIYSKSDFVHLDTGKARSWGS